MTMQFAIVFVNEGNGYQITPKAGDVAYRNHGDTHVTCKGI
jgi:hypothetical protein